MEKLKQKKTLIEKELIKLQPEEIEWSKDVIEKIQEFTTRGKMLRGSLFLRTYEILGGKKDYSKVALALELTQSAILSHDDIMDKDNTRRGKETIHKQYTNIINDEHYGYSMAMCLGDIGFFQAFKHLPQEVIDIYADEMTKCAYGQMQDIHYTYSNQEITPKQIINIYKYKTARYTFSLPMMIAAKLAGKEEKIFSELGENLGIIFQIIDDQLGILGDKKEIGKTPGADITENKKTLHRYYLLQKYPELKKYYGTTITNEQLQLIQQKTQEIQPIINQTLSTYTKKVDELIQKLPCEKQFFEELSQYNLKRLK
jgi:geranylgeranyl diphosphate synthase, type I